MLTEIGIGARIDAILSEWSHTWMAWPFAEASILPSGDHDTNERSLPASLLRSLPVPGSQMSTVPSPFSRASILPSRDQPGEETPASQDSLLVATSSKRTVLFTVPESSSMPSGDQANRSARVT